MTVTGKPGRFGRCDHCSKPFPQREGAPHKRFCGVACRQAWHTERRRQAMRLLEEVDLPKQGPKIEGTGL